MRGVERLVLEPFAKACPCCKKPTRIDFHNHRTVHNRDATFELTLKIRRCTNSNCYRFHVAHRPEAEWHFAPPSRQFGWRIISQAMENAGNARRLLEMREDLARRGRPIRHRTLLELASFGQRLLSTARDGLSETAIAILREQKYALLNLVAFNSSTFIAQETFSGLLIGSISNRESPTDTRSVLRPVIDSIPCPVTICFCPPAALVVESAAHIVGHDRVFLFDATTGVFSRKAFS